MIYMVSVCMTISKAWACVMESERLHQGSESAESGRSNAVFTIPRQQSKQAQGCWQRWTNVLGRKVSGCMKCWWRKLIVDDYWAHGCCIVGLVCIEVMHVRIWMFGYPFIELTAKITVNWLKLRIKILHHIDCSTKFCIAFK